MKNLTNKTLLVLGGLLLIIVGISSGCIGGNGDGGDAASDVTGGSGTAVQQETAPKTQTQPNTETAVKKPVLPKSMRALTPGEVSLRFLDNIKKGDYRNAMKHMDPSSPIREETLFNAFSKMKIEKMEIIKEKKGEEIKRLSKETGKEVVYKRSVVQVKMEYTKNNEKDTDTVFLRLTEINGAWKISDLGASSL